MFKDLPPLQPLVAFEAAVRLGSFKEAAAELHVTPSAISQQIRLLEEALGFELFERRHREIAVTELGQRYVQCVSETLTNLDRETRRTRRRTREPILRVATDAFIANEYLVPNMAAFRQRAPGLDLRVETGMALVDLKRGQVDVALRILKSPPSDPELCWTELQGQRFVLVAAPSIAADITTPQELAHASFVCVEDQFEGLRAGIAQRASVDVQPESLLLMDTYYGMLRAAELGHGVACALEPLTDPWLKRGRLVALRNGAAPIERALYFVCMRRHAERPSIRLLRAWLEGLFVTPAANR
jgi:LysR family glycine cleavage system transcriptional activator